MRRNARRTFDLPVRELVAGVESVKAGRERMVLDAVFNGARGRPRQPLELHGAELLPGQRVWKPVPNVARFSLRWPPATENISLEVGTSGQPLDLVKFILRDEQGDKPLAVIRPGKTGAGTSVHLPGTTDWEEVTNALDPVGYLESLDARLKVLEDDSRLRPRRFFAALDREMNTFLLQGMVQLGRIHREEADHRRMAVEAIGNELRNRVQIRCRGLDEAAKNCPRLEERVFEHLKGKCRQVSRIFLDLIDQHLGNDPRAFESAFTAFANGDLRFDLPSLVMTTQPSSANFFLFGEFALMAEQYAVSPERWSRLANVMVRSQRIFARVYAPESLEGADLFSYSGQDYARRGKPYSDAELAALEREFAGADLPLEAARTASTSMPGLLLK